MDILVNGAESATPPTVTQKAIGDLIAYAEHLPPIRRAPPKMPPEIAKAIVKVMAQIKALDKDGENKFQKYSYVSVDQFFEAVGRLMAGAGIFVMPFEASMDIALRKSTDDYGKVKESVWLSAVYDLYVYHESGVEYGPIPRSIQVLASGPQSYASAMSFVEKYFLRSLFKIPTGDGDADGDPKHALPGRHEPQREPARNLEDERREIEEAARGYIAMAKREWATLASQKDMQDWWAREKAGMTNLFAGKEDPLYVELKAAFAARGKELPEAPAASAAKEPEKTEAKPAAKAEAKDVLQSVRTGDDIPFQGVTSGKPRPSLTVLRITFREALVASVTEAVANQCYAELIAPHADALSEAERAEFAAMLRRRLGEING